MFPHVEDTAAGAFISWMTLQILEKVDASVVAEFEGKAAEEQCKLKEAYV